MKYRGRPVLAAISGFFTGLFLALDLVFFGVIRLDNIAVTVLPVVGLVAGVAARAVGTARPGSRSRRRRRGERMTARGSLRRVFGSWWER